MKLRDLTGQRFGRLTVVERGENTKTRLVQWLCVCDCGSRKAIRSHNLCGGSTRSCGCLETENQKYGSIVHGQAGKNKTPEYRAWGAARNRCFNPTNPKYADYGGRGISVCTRWGGDQGFQNFLLDMGQRPAGTSLDRFPNNNGNYEPCNCRWASPTDQRRNQRKCQAIENFSDVELANEVQRRAIMKPPILTTAK